MYLDHLSSCLRISLISNDSRSNSAARGLNKTEVSSPIDFPDVGFLFTFYYCFSFNLNRQICSVLTAGVLMSRRLISSATSLGYCKYSHMRICLLYLSSPAASRKKNKFASLLLLRRLIPLTPMISLFFLSSITKSIRFLDTCKKLLVCISDSLPLCINSKQLPFMIASTLQWSSSCYSQHLPICIALNFYRSASKINRYCNKQ